MTDRSDLNDRVALSMGWTKLPDGRWLNSFGADIDELPDFSGDDGYAQVVVRSFETGTLSKRSDILQAREFFRGYHEGMIPLEICEWALAVRQMY